MQQLEATPRYLKKTDVCKALGISPRTLENLVASNAFPAGVRIGKFCFWSDKVIYEWHRRQFAIQETWRPV